MEKILEKPPIFLFGAMILLSIIMHFRVFNMDLVGFHVWRQTQTQTHVLNFAREDMNILHPKLNINAETNRIHRMEFPIMQWGFAVFYRILGNHIFISRFLTFLIGLCTLLGFYSFLRIIFQHKTPAMMGTWAFNFSPVFYYYTLNPLPDNFALCASVWGLRHFYKWKTTQQKKYIFLSAIFLSLSTLAKLPFILYGAVMGTSLLIDLAKKGRAGVRDFSYQTAIFLLALIPAFLWYAWVIPTWKGNGIVQGITDLQTSYVDMLDILRHNFVSTLPELLINYGALGFFLAGIIFFLQEKKYRSLIFLPFCLWGIALLVYFFFEMNMIAKVHDYYLMPFLPLIFVTIAYGAYRLYLQKGMYRNFVWLCLMVLPITAFLRINGRWNPEKPGFNPDYYRYKSEVRSLIPQNARCVVGNESAFAALLYYIDRKGWAYTKDQLDSNKLVFCRENGAEYLFLDLPVEDFSGLEEQIQAKIAVKGSIQIYKLKPIP